MGRKASGPRKPPPEEVDDAPVVVRRVSPDDWGPIETLFGERGACGGCWCMAWRLPRRANNWQEAKGDKNRASLHRLLDEGQLHAVLAFAGETPVGWCSFGPRGSFPFLVQSRALRTDWNDSTWSITCFYIDRHWRNRGVAGQLLAAATEEAFASGADEVEGYPVVPAKLPSPIPAAFAWTGVPSLFQGAGYSALPRPASARPIFVKKRPAGR